jgi:glycosyltransferase involved in cell wall biosynthesis
MKKNKVLFLISQTTNKSNGGVESITQVIESLAGTMELFVITQKNTARTQRWQEVGAKVYVTNIDWMGGKLKKILSLALLSLLVFRVTVANRINVIHFNDVFAYTICGLPVSWFGKRIIFNIRDTYEKGRPYPKKWNWMIKKAHRIIVLSKEMKSFISERFPFEGVAEKIESIYSIVDFDRFYSAQKIDTDESVLKIGIVAAFMDKKQQLDFFKQGLSFFEGYESRVRFHFVGDFEPDKNEYARQCKKVIDEHPLQNIVVFDGFQSNVENSYREFDISLVISKREGLARCMIESLSCGVPVISFDVSSAKEILEDKHLGFVVSQGNYKELSDKVKLLVDSPEERKEMSKNAVDLSRELFNKTKILEEYSEIYRTLQ